MVEKTVYIDDPTPDTIVGGMIETDVYYESGACLTSPLLPASPLVAAAETVVVAPTIPGPIVAAPAMGTVMAGSTVFSHATTIVSEPTIVSRTVERRASWIDPMMPSPMIAPTMTSTILAPGVFVPPPVGRRPSIGSTVTSSTSKKSGKLSRMLHRHRSRE
jgi:hypothetical protein